MRAAIVKISTVFLAECIGLPHGAMIRAVRLNFEQPDLVELVVEHYALPPVRPGAQLLARAIRYQMAERLAPVFKGWD